MNGKGLSDGGNVGAEAGQYTRRMRRVTAAEEPTPEKIREDRPRHSRPVPETDTGGRVEYTEALERLTVKELGKLAP